VQGDGAFAGRELDGDSKRAVVGHDGTFHVLINDEGQYSLWPAFVDVPAGWTIVRESDTRQNCLDYITENWTDMRPNSLIRAMEQK
jgi:MbtH protein